MERMNLQDKQLVFEEGAQSDGAYLVLQGEIEILAKRDGVDHFLARLSSGEVFGEIGLIAERPRSASARARGPASLLRISRAEFERLLNEDPREIKTFLSALIDRLLVMNEKFLTAKLELDELKAIHGRSERRFLPED